MTPQEARGYIDGLDFCSKQDVWGEFPSRYDHWDAFEAFATIAGLRYEYAVVCLVEGDVWRYARGGVLITPLEHEATWHPTREEAEAYAERRRSTAKETRVVPRLVSDVEVVA